MYKATDIPESELDFSAIRASGPGGQNVNKVSTAIHLRFDIHASSLPESLKADLLALRDRRIYTDGILVIKAQRSRSQENNRQDAIDRLDELLAKAQFKHKQRRASRPSRSSVRKRLDSKTKHGAKKSLRKDLGED